MNADAAIVSLYVMVLVGMGLCGGRKVKSAADFTAAGGRYGAWALFASLSSSYVGGGYSAGAFRRPLRRAAYWRSRSGGRHGSRPGFSPSAVVPEWSPRR